MLQCSAFHPPLVNKYLSIGCVLLETVSPHQKNQLKNLTRLEKCSVNQRVQQHPVVVQPCLPVLTNMRTFLPYTYPRMKNNNLIMCRYALFVFNQKANDVRTLYNVHYNRNFNFKNTVKEMEGNEILYLPHTNYNH